jgi:CopG family nickel-responsive transcriptional regulator
MPHIERFGVSIDSDLLAGFDRMIAEKGYPSRSEAVRDLVRGLMVREKWGLPEGIVVGAITLVYDHQARMLDYKLTHLQHDYHDLIRFSTHLHLDERHCVQVVIVGGPAGRVRELADRLSALKGVKHAELSCTGVAWEEDGAEEGGYEREHEHAHGDGHGHEHEHDHDHAHEHGQDHDHEHGDHEHEH